MAKPGEARGSYTATHANATPPGLDVYRLRNPNRGDGAARPRVDCGDCVRTGAIARKSWPGVVPAPIAGRATTPRLSSPESTRAPSREALRARSRESIHCGAVHRRIDGADGDRPHRSGESLARRVSVADRGAACRSNAGVPTSLVASRSGDAPVWNGWGVDASNARFQPAALAGLSVRNVPKLTLKWAFGIPGAMRRERPANGLCRPRVHRQRRTAPSTRSTQRAGAFTGSSRPPAVSAARSPSRHWPATSRPATPHTSATSGPTCTPWTRSPASRSGR